MIAHGELASRFGAPSEAPGTTWIGTFVWCTPAHEVKSGAAGQVVCADWLRSFGSPLIVGHRDGYVGPRGTDDAPPQPAGATVPEGGPAARAGA